ncbi:predicted protein [Plenodomus lingam JN3]|uniref:Predicted protein n=1 Tax=Leptosphaeria maculans (strain JN3 / isolate v23.1.3 / race Av1-4-5-6-7-8) TaxID=985895 RepID=E5A057_LEPMJ|nr:predicted protein [Plenodomus lingam JN3]CBX96917.1 predicted protein [Plenodomus lingam JN3]
MRVYAAARPMEIANKGSSVLLCGLVWMREGGKEGYKVCIVYKLHPIITKRHKPRNKILIRHLASPSP